MTITAERPATWDAVEQAQAGDMDAFGRIYQAHHDSLFRFVYYRVNNRQVAEDLCSTVWVRALASIGSLRWMGKGIGAWLTTVARNLVTDYHRSGAYRMSFPAGVIYEDDAVQVDPVPDPADEVAARAVSAVVAEAVGCLNDEQRTCIELRFYQGLSLAETAAVMGKNAGAVKAMQFRAVAALRHLLAGLEVR